MTKSLDLLVDAGDEEDFLKDCLSEAVAADEGFQPAFPWNYLFQAQSLGQKRSLFPRIQDANWRFFYLEAPAGLDGPQGCKDEPHAHQSNSGIPEEVREEYRDEPLDLEADSLKLKSFQRLLSWGEKPVVKVPGPLG